MTVWVVLLRDRHFDDVVEVFASKAGVDKAVDDFKRSHEAHMPSTIWTWHERAKTWTCYDDGPTIQVAEMEVQP